MTAVIFVGPTLAPDAVSACLNATILPPVQQGDVYRVARDQPDAIGIIDGFFEGVPSVWHKEILWAMEQGIPVFGSASMGALRAAELADFGMIGVGRIFEDYLNGVLHDDDEVAVLHSPAELGFQPLSEPMVSVRATVDKAEKVGVLSADSAARLLQHAKAINYRQRVWPDIVGAMQALPEISEFEEWLPNERIDAKAEDARAMLTRMAEHLGCAPLPPLEAVRTEPTLMWKALCARVDGQKPAADRAVVDELRLNPTLFSEIRDRAALALLSQEDAMRQGRTPERAELVRQMEDHRTNSGLTLRSELMEWIDANDLTAETYEAMLTDAAHVDAAVTARADRLEAQLVSELRRLDLYADLRSRASSKAKHAMPKFTTGVDRLRALLWYFETRLDQGVPDDLDSYAVSLGLTGRDAFNELIEAEFLFCHRGADPEDPSS